MARIHTLRSRPNGGDNLKIVRVRTKETLARFEEHQLVLRAIRKVRYPGAHPVELFADLFDNIELDSRGVFVGYAGERPVAVAAVLLPTTPLMMAPQAVIVYNEGAARLARAMADRLWEWVMKAGHDRVLGLNLWRDDRVFQRGFRHFGEARVMGSLIEFRRR